MTRDLPFQALALPCVPLQTSEQFTAFSVSEDWQQFWCQYGQGAPPPVNFERGYTLVGVVGSGPGVTVSEVTRAGDRITVTVGSGGTMCSCHAEPSLLLVVPHAPRVDFRFLPRCG